MRVANIAFKEVGLERTVNWVGICTNESAGWQKPPLRSHKSVSCISTSLVQDAHCAIPFVHGRAHIPFNERAPAVETADATELELAVIVTAAITSELSVLELAVIVIVTITSEPTVLELTTAGRRRHRHRHTRNPYRPKSVDKLDEPFAPKAILDSPTPLALTDAFPDPPQSQGCGPASPSVWSCVLIHTAGCVRAVVREVSGNIRAIRERISGLSIVAICWRGR